MNIDWDMANAATDAAHFRMLDREHVMEVAMERQKALLVDEVLGQDLPAFLFEEAMTRIMCDAVESGKFDENVIEIVNHPDNCGFFACRIKDLIHKHARQAIDDPAILAKLMASGKYSEVDYDLL